MTKPDLHETRRHIVEPIGIIKSSIMRREDAPRQGREGGVDAWIHIDKNVAAGLKGLEVGHEIVVLTWFHQADRNVLAVHPRGDLRNPLTGVFATRSPDRPNPIGLHEVVIREIAGDAMRVFPLEAIDGTPVIDIKPVL